MLIEDYALIGDCQSAALVSRTGSIDWLCLPRFDSSACFAALLGTPDNGRWLIQPRSKVVQTKRRYRSRTLILETDYETEEGEVRVIDFMPNRTKRPDLVRIVQGRRGRVPMRVEVTVRFDYGSIVPWVMREGNGIVALAGPEALHIHSDVPLQGADFRHVGDFEVDAGRQFSFVLQWHRSNENPTDPPNPVKALTTTETWWRRWADKCTYRGEWQEDVIRSLITLKAMTYTPTGGMVAAVTTSLPECIGGVRNWDYRFCWLRDATFTLYALLLNGYKDEAQAWREWLMRAVAGKASQLNLMYGVSGERRLPELELEWLPGYEDSKPVRVGNAAYKQFQLDVFGEVGDCLHLARCHGLQTTEDGWRVERELLDFLEKSWNKPDEGIWEVRGPRRHFTHSKVMAWVSLDRAVRDSTRFHLEGPTERWTALRDHIHAEVCEKGFDREIGSFVQSYGSKDLDASLLMLPLVGFLPADDPRIRATVDAIEKGLLHDGFVHRYTSKEDVDGLPQGEGVFLLCTFWLADNYVLQGRMDEARQVFERLLAIRNDLGLLSEQYDPAARRLLGNFPQAFSHVGLINTAHNLSIPRGPAVKRPVE